MVKSVDAHDVGAMTPIACNVSHLPQFRLWKSAVQGAEIEGFYSVVIDNAS